jgi:DNA-binding GntR family transcriptional regulator
MMADGIAGALREEIQLGALVPGEPIRQEEVAARFGVSRIPVREAFGRLEAEGLVVVRPNRGAFVAVLTAEELREAYELRALVEGDLLTRAVTGLTTAHLARAEALHAALAADDPGEQGDLNREFHRVLLDPAAAPDSAPSWSSCAAGWSATSGCNGRCSARRRRSRRSTAASSTRADGTTPTALWPP